MTQRPKRKYDSYDSYETTSAPMPPTAAGPSNIYDPSLGTPTPELQELYNNWRQQQELQAHLQSDLSPGAQDGHNGLLRPPSPTATTMSRSPSCASTSNSVTRDVNNMDLGEDRPQPKRRTGRQGPLDGPDKARTALLRKLRACASCRKRKVKCKHYNFDLFEKAYQALKQSTPSPQPPATNPDISAQQNDLIGVGYNPNVNSTFPSYLAGQVGQEDAHIDLDDILQQARNTQRAPVSPNTSPLYNFLGTWPNMTSPTPAPAPPPLTALPQYFGSLSPLSPYNPVALEPAHIPIGREVSQEPTEWEDGTTTTTEEWECRYGDDGTASSHSNNVLDDLAICKQRYGTLDDLEEHFQVEHVPFEHGKVYPRCKKCDLNSFEDYWDSCLQCNERGVMERWYFGNIYRAGAGKRKETREVRVGDGGGGGGLVRSQTVTQFNVNSLGLGFGGYGGNGNGNANANAPSGSGSGSSPYRYSPGGGWYGNAAQSQSHPRQYPVINMAFIRQEPHHPAFKMSPPGIDCILTADDDLCCSGVLPPSEKGGTCSYSPYYAYTKEFSRIRNRSKRRHNAPISKLRLIAVPSRYLRQFNSAHPAFLKLLVLSLIMLVVTQQGWVSGTATGAARRLKSSPSSSVGMGVHIAEISGVCVLVGLFGMWLVRHVRLKLLLAAGRDEMRSRRQLYQRQQRCLLRDIIGAPQRRDLEGVSRFATGGSGQMSDHHCFHDGVSAAVPGS